eukprot:scaffold3408_cov129-Amphora_coffeaeformis.AAC.6
MWIFDNRDNWDECDKQEAAVDTKEGGYTCFAWSQFLSRTTEMLMNDVIETATSPCGSTIIYRRTHPYSYQLLASS